MTELNISTPAVLFPAISLLMLAYTNRYVAISNRIRLLHKDYHTEKSEIALSQIKILKKRANLIKNMQLYGVVSIFFAALTMFLIFENVKPWPTWTFLMSMVSLLGSLILTIIEVTLSNKALFILLKDIELDLEKYEE